jgi:hypothetical protein
VRARLDGTVVLDAWGDTIIRPGSGSRPGADRIQIGLTASSNTVPAEAFFDNVRVAISR